MTRRILPFVAALSLLVIAGVFVFRPLPTSITPANAERVKPGMTLAEVAGILGEPRNEVVLPPPVNEFGSHIGIFTTFRQRRCVLCRWIGESWQIVVELDTDTERDVLAVDVSEHTFGSAWEFAHWRVRRVLGLAPDEPTGIEGGGIYVKKGLGTGVPQFDR